MTKKKQTKIIFLSVLGIMITIVLIIIGFWSASAFFLIAHHVDFTSARPFMIVQYWQKYGHMASIKKSLQLSSMGGGLIAILPPLILYAILGKKPSLYGDAKFAKSAEINKNDFFKKTDTSLVIGKFNNRILYYNGIDFLALAAKSRAGKGVSVIMPTALTYNQSLVPLDVKEEIFKITSGYRAKVLKQKVFKFAPFTSETHRWNPLSYLSKDIETRISDAINLAQILYPDKNGEDAFFNSMARDLFVGFVLYLMDTPTLTFTLGYIRRMASGFGKPLNEYILSIVNDRDNSFPTLSKECVEKLSVIANQSANTIPGIVGTFLQPLGLWSSAYIDAATSDDDFDLRNLRREKTTIYFCVPPDKVDEAKVIINLFYSQLLNVNLDTLPEDDPTLKYQLLLLLDEFTAAGAIKPIEKSVAYIAGYGIRIALVFQNRAQIKQVYGDDGLKILMANIKLTIIFAPTNDPVTDSQEYSEMIGYKTVKGRSISRGGGRGGQSVSESEQKRALMLPQELRAMPLEDEIILVHGMNPIYAKKITYWNDPEFKPKIMPPIPIPKIDVHNFMLLREERIFELDAQTILNAEYNIDEIADIEEIMQLIDESTTEEEIKEIVNNYYALKTGLSPDEISEL
jgi:type IV secretion system protein VirD4